MCPVTVGRQIGFVVSVCSVVAVVIYSLWRSAYGIDFTDEAALVAIPMRYVFGDLPFRDELITTFKNYDIFISPLFRLRPTLTLLELRHLNIFVRLLGALSLIGIARRYAPLLFITSLGCAYFFLDSSFGILCPSYNSISSAALSLGACLWLEALAGDKYVRLKAGLAGAVVGIAVISYLPQVFLLLIPLAVAVGPSKGGQSRRAAVMVIVGFAIWMLPFLLWVTTKSLWSDIGSAAQQVFAAYHASAAHKIAIGVEMLAYFPRLVPGGAAILIVTILGAVLAVIARKYEVLLIRFAVLVTLAISWLTIIRPTSADLSFMFLAGILLPVTSVTLLHDRWQVPASWCHVYFTASVWGVISAGTYGMSTYFFGPVNSYAVAVQGIGPTAIVAGVELHRAAARHHATVVQRVVILACLYLAGAGLVAGGFRLFHPRVYRDAALTNLTAEFSTPALAGIYSTPERVRQVELLCNFVNAHVAPGQLLLSYDDFPLTYFVTRTRPAYGLARTGDMWSSRVTRGLVEQMIRRGRAPHYVVRIATQSENWALGRTYAIDNALDQFVKANYCLLSCIYPFEIWAVRDQCSGACRPDVERLQELTCSGCGDMEIRHLADGTVSSVMARGGGSGGTVQLRLHSAKTAAERIAIKAVIRTSANVSPRDVEFAIADGGRTVKTNTVEQMRPSDISEWNEYLFSSRKEANHDVELALRWRSTPNGWIELRSFRISGDAAGI